MNIMEVMKKENLGKRYTSEGREFVLFAKNHKVKYCY